jgi:DNA-binding transcriptional regulator GbsR (MarR family)
MQLSDGEKNFIEEVGVVFEQTGLPRMSGRMFGWLLISDPPYQSASELAEVLMASKGSISTTVRLLVQMGIVERFIIPGERHDHFRLGEDALLKIIQRGLEDEVKMFRRLGERGLELMSKEPAVRRQWLEEMRDRYAYLEKTFPELLKEYDNELSGQQ